MMDAAEYARQEARRFRAWLKARQAEKAEEPDPRDDNDEKISPDKLRGVRL